MVIAGAGFVSDLMIRLMNEIRAIGGSENSLHILVRPEGKSILEHLAEQIVNVEKQKLHIIDCDADPFVPRDLELESHIRQGHVVFDLNTIELYLSEDQKNDSIPGLHLLDDLESLKGKTPCNANVLDWLLKPENQKYIPESWNSKHIYFWGTIYRRRDFGLFVRCLYRYNAAWRCSHCLLKMDWCHDQLAAVMPKPSYPLVKYIKPIC